MLVIYNHYDTGRPLTLEVKRLARATHGINGSRYQFDGLAPTYFVRLTVNATRTRATGGDGTRGGKTSSHGSPGSGQLLGQSQPNRAKELQQGKRRHNLDVFARYVLFAAILPRFSPNSLMYGMPFRPNVLWTPWNPTRGHGWL